MVMQIVWSEEEEKNARLARLAWTQQPKNVWMKKAEKANKRKTTRKL